MSELLALHPPAQAELLGLSLSSYTEDLGRGTRLAEAVAALYDDSVTPEDVLILSGVDPVIHDTFAALIEPGMRVALQTPAYPPLRNVPAWRGAEVVEWEPTSLYGGWNVAATESADVVVATSPHSPFGWTPDEEWLRSLAASVEARNQLLVVDEIYRGLDLTTDGSGVLPSACELSERAIVFGGLAKTYGLTGLRVGWLVCRDEATRERIVTHSFNTNSNLCAPTELLGTLAVEHTSALLQANAKVARANLERVEAFVERSAGLFSWRRPTAGLNAWLVWHGPGSARQLAASVLSEERVSVADHTLFGMADTAEGGGLRVGLGPDDMPRRLEKLEAAVARFVREQR